jgi:hypothetical protein
LIDARRDSTWATLDLDGFLRSTEDAYRDVLGWAMGKGGAAACSLTPRGRDASPTSTGARALPGYPGALEQADEALQAWARRLRRRGTGTTSPDADRAGGRGPRHPGRGA